MFKIVRPDWSHNLMNTAKTIEFDLYMHTNKQYNSFFQSYTHQTYKEIQNKKHVNCKPKVQSNTMFRISKFQTTDIHPKTEWLDQ